jgi:hypothetical protein
MPTKDVREYISLQFACYTRKLIPKHLISPHLGVFPKASGKSAFR